MAFVENKYYHLEELSGSDYEIIDGEPNIIGWDVKNEKGQLVGEVDNLLFDRQSRKVRYIVLDLNSNKLHLDTDRKVLIPIGIAELFRKGGEKQKRDHDKEDHTYYPDEDGNVVILPEVTIEHLNALPLYEKDHLSPHVERAIRSIFTQKNKGELPPDTAYSKDEFYRHEHFNDDRFYKGKKDKD